jgi:lipopolysaccharide export LptBFGC system permease protein LptF
MSNEILNQIVQIIIAIIFGVIGRYVVPVALIKRKEIEQRIGIEKAHEMENKAFQIWKEVDEYFRISDFVGDKIKAKQKKFEEFMLKKFPSLTGEQIVELRQTVAGEINKGKAKLVPSNAVQIDANQLQTLQDKANKFDQLQNALSQGNPIPENPQTAQKTN